MDATQSLCNLRLARDPNPDDFDPWSDIPDETDAHQYVALKSRIEAITHADTFWLAWRKLKSARQLFLNRRRRETPEGRAAYEERLKQAAHQRRERAKADPDYRAKRNAQSHTGRRRNASR